MLAKASCPSVHLGSPAFGAKLPASKSASLKKHTHTFRPPKYRPSRSMYAFIAAACLANLTNMRTRSSSGAPSSASSYTNTSATSPYLEHSSPISPRSSASTSEGATIFLSSSTRLGRPRNVTAPFFSLLVEPAAATAPAMPVGGAGGGGGGGGGRRSDALTMTPVCPSLFLAISGVFIPCPSFPSPWPSLHPIFCSMARPGSPVASAALKPAGIGGGGGGGGCDVVGGERGRLPEVPLLSPSRCAEESDEKALLASSCFRCSASSNFLALRPASTSFTHSS
mmetsp:Transcript_35860/g.59423  ORF Transcript_35860/g.59423 Transcript_35860/m.59423 type:complete len:282 (-) Transcript_35860:466-1311(-)